MDTTHEVFNQPEPLVNYNLFEGNRGLRNALKFNAPGLDTAELVRLGAQLGTADMQAHAWLANVHLPELHTHDRFGRRIDEVELSGAGAWLVGEEGRGVPQILAMGTMPRLDCALGTSGLMRQSLSLALNHTAQRQAFGKPLIQQPLMRNVLAYLAIESEAACALFIRLTRCFAIKTTRTNRPWHACSRRSSSSGSASAAARLPRKRCSTWAATAMWRRVAKASWRASTAKCRSIQSGKAQVNIMALDLLRALRKLDAVAALAQELRAAQGAHPALDRLAAVLSVRLEEMTFELQARRLAQDVALALQAALLCQSASRAVADAFCESRLAGHWGQTFGTLPSRADFDGTIGQAMPQQA